MNVWIIIWKVVFVFAVCIFAVMAVWVSVAGLRDIKKLFATIDESHRRKSE